jgi:D-xylose 1-dehydrogenase (NADP+, D-xylono-1,5-lactone-forming)
MPIVRWGLLGTARINRRLIPAMRAAGRSEVHVVASREGPRAETFGQEWDIPHAVSGYSALLARDDVDAVYIPLPNSLHAEWCLASIAAGKHVLCEKPLAANPEDVERIEAASLRHDVIVAEGFMYRHEPLTRAVVSLVRDGAIGAVRTINSGFTYARSRAADVRLEKALGGGALLDVGCYPVSYACLLVGRDAEHAAGLARFTTGGVDEEFTGLLGFPGDRTASIYAGFRAASHTWLEIAGSEGWLRVPNPFKPGPAEKLDLERLGQHRAIEVSGSTLPFVRQIDDFVCAVLDGALPVMPLAESRRVAAALQALAASAAEGEA